MILASAIALVIAGCSATQQRREPVVHEEKAPPPEVKVSSTDMRVEHVTLVKKAPAAATLGDTFANTLSVAAHEDVADVIVTDTVPAGSSFVRSEPPAKVSGNTLVWNFPSMKKGETKDIQVYIKAEKEGELSSCCGVTATPLYCVKTIVGRPALAITKTGPETALLGAEVTYNITVRNTGNAIAKEVVITDNVPAGLSHDTGNKTLTFPVGDLAPGQSKSVPVKFKTTQRGRICNPAIAKASNTAPTNAEACTLVSQPGLAIKKTGDARQFLTKNANYTIVVTNTGDITLNGVAVIDTAPAVTKIVLVTGASVSGNTAMWTVGDLAAGQSRSFNVVLTSGTVGTHCNTAAVRSTQGLAASSEACTVWQGISALLIEVVDDPDPIQVGEQTTITIRVTNQGSADDTNIAIVANFGPQIDPTSADSNGTVSGKTVKWPIVPKLGSKQSFTYRIIGKATTIGDHRLKVLMTSDVLTNPVTEEESTRVY